MEFVRRYNVRVDDPDMARAHEFVVTAQHSIMARLAGARRALLIEGALRDPNTGQRMKLWWRVRHALSHDLVACVAAYAVATPRRRR